MKYKYVIGAFQMGLNSINNYNLQKTNSYFQCQRAVYNMLIMQISKSRETNTTDDQLKKSWLGEAAY